MQLQPHLTILTICKYKTTPQNNIWGVDMKGQTMRKTYNKLVRDKIPEIIESEGQTCQTHILSDIEYIKALESKLDEEVAEYHSDKNLEELADITEVIHALCTAHGYSIHDLESIRLKKANNKGTFSKKIYLETSI